MATSRRFPDPVLRPSRRLGFGSDESEGYWAWAIGDEMLVTSTGSTTARLLRDRFADLVNVKDFGAKGDGVTDDTAAIQAAFDAGSHVQLPAGTCLFSAPLTVTATKRIEGAADGTVLRFTGNTAAGAIQIGFQGSNLSGLSMRDLRIEKTAGATAERLLHLRGVERSLFERLQIGGTAVGTGATNDNVLLEKSWINTFVQVYSRRAGRYGLHLKAQTSYLTDASNDNQFIGCDFEDNVSAGAYAIDSEHNAFLACSFGDFAAAGQHGVHLNGRAHATVIRDCYFESHAAAKNDIRLDGANDNYAVIVEGNWHRGGPSVGIYLDRAGSARVRDNAGVLTGTFAQVTANTDRAWLSGNLFTSAATYISDLGTNTIIEGTQAGDLVLHPSRETSVSQTGAVYQGSGVPNNANGSNGDFYFRTDTPGVANQRFYVKSAGAWVGIL